MAGFILLASTSVSAAAAAVLMSFLPLCHALLTRVVVVFTSCAVICEEATKKIKRNERWKKSANKTPRKRKHSNWGRFVFVSFSFSVSVCQADLCLCVYLPCLIKQIIPSSGVYPVCVCCLCSMFSATTTDRIGPLIKPSPEENYHFWKPSFPSTWAVLNGNEHTHRIQLNWTRLGYSGASLHCI